MKNVDWKKRLMQAVWLMIGVGTIILLGAAIKKKDQQHCTEVAIEITGAEKEKFIDDKELMEILNSTGNVTAKNIADINLKNFEAALEKNLWVKNAELFFDNNNVLHVNIEERTPIVRVFANDGGSFYVDSSLLHLPLSDRVTARVPVFTGFPTKQLVLSHPDSLLLKDVVSIGKFIANDSFWMAQIQQVDITRIAGFEIIPTIGDQVIEFGNAENIEDKFNRLYTFYKQAWLQNGMNTYERLKVQFDNQVVGVKKGTAKAMMDSTTTNHSIATMDSVQTTPSVITHATDSVSNHVQRNISKTQNKRINNALSNGRNGKRQEPKAVMKGNKR
jgi:cell division protein FtsQ